MSKTAIHNDNPKHKRKSLVGKIIAVILPVMLAALVVTVVVNVVMNQNFTVSFYQLRCDKVSSNIRIVELSDLHSKEYGKDNAKLVDKIRALQPDLIVYAGDMINFGSDDYSVLFTLSDQLCEIAPIYACYGDDDLDQYLFKDKEFPKKLSSHGVTLLSNESADVKVGNTMVQFIAVSDGPDQFDIETNNAKKFLDRLEPTTNCRICLTHYPELFKDKLLNRGIDVAFTGHAHGGLIRLPKIGGLYSHGEGFLPTFSEGVVETKDGAQVVVSRGLGDSGWIPRINNQPELVVVDVCWY